MNANVQNLFVAFANVTAALAACKESDVKEFYEEMLPRLTDMAPNVEPGDMPAYSMMEALSHPEVMSLMLSIAQRQENSVEMAKAIGRVKAAASDVAKAVQKNIKYALPVLYSGTDPIERMLLMAEMVGNRKK